MDEQGDVVIVGRDGTEHVFPSGFDPKRAASIVSGRNGQADPKTAPSSLDLLTGRGLSGGEGTDESTLAGVVKMLEPMAHPTTASDMAGLLLPTGVPNLGVRGAVSGFLRTAKSAATESPTIRQIPGRMLGKLYRSAFPNEASLAAEAEQLAQPARAAIKAQVAQGGEQFQMPRADITVDRPPRAAQVIGEGPAPAITPEGPGPAAAPGGTMSAAERAQLAKQGYSPDVIAKIEAQMKPVASHAPTPPESPLRQPRIAEGAERVGRSAGLSKDDVRAQTGPILGETPGTASPILPENALGRIVDALKQLPPGGPEREAYVKLATSGKAQWQIENIRRTLEHLGLLLPVGAAIPTVRDRLMDRMRSPQE